MKCVECHNEEATHCSLCVESISKAMYHEEGELGNAIVTYCEKYLGHYPPTAADLVNHPEIKILTEALYA